MLVQHISRDTMLTKQSEMQSQVILISSLNKGVLNSYFLENDILMKMRSPAEAGAESHEPASAET